MTDNELLIILEKGGQVSVPYFDGSMIQVEKCDLSLEEVLPAFKRFLSLTAEQRRSDARHLLAYCKMIVYAVGEDALEDMGGSEPGASLIFFDKLEAGKYASKPTIYVQIEGNVDWEPEHGLQMSWAEGDRLVKVSAFDGHPTNAHASAKPEDDQYVFECYKREFCTFPDPV